MAILKIKDEKGNIIPIPSIRGEKGQDGLTPFINDNGNWQIGDKDTGVSASADGKIGDIETALDSIISIQNSLIGGENV